MKKTSSKPARKPPPANTRLRVPPVEVSVTVRQGDGSVLSGGGGIYGDLALTRSVSPEGMRETVGHGDVADVLRDLANTLYGLRTVDEVASAEVVVLLRHRRTP